MSKYKISSVKQLIEEATGTDGLLSVQASLERPATTRAFDSRPAGKAPAGVGSAPRLITFVHYSILLLVLCYAFVLARASPHTTPSEEADEEAGDLPVWAQLVLAVVLVCLSAVFAGLTLGVMGIDTLTLEIIAESGPEPDTSYAKRILPIRRKGHQTLCTLVVGNMLANVLIAQFCADVNPEGGHDGEGGGLAGLAGFLLSTFIILIFAEILPMSICKSSRALEIASASVPLVNFFVIVLYPVAKPLGILLDRIVHHDVGQIYDRTELRDLMIRHVAKFADTSGMDTRETQMILGALEFRDKRVRDIMVPLKEVFCVYSNCIIDKNLIEFLWAQGYSRVPVIKVEGPPRTIEDIRKDYDTPELKQQVMTLLFVKDLINLSLGDDGATFLGSLPQAATSNTSLGGYPLSSTDALLPPGASDSVAALSNSASGVPSTSQITGPAGRRALTIEDFVKSTQERDVLAVREHTKLTRVMEQVCKGVAHLLIVIQSSKNANSMRSEGGRSGSPTTVDESNGGAHDAGSNPDENDDNFCLYNAKSSGKAGDTMACESGSSDDTIVGIVTVEDILEALIRGEIYDEFEVDAPSKREDQEQQQRLFEEMDNEPLCIYYTEALKTRHYISRSLHKKAKQNRTNFYSFYIDPLLPRTLDKLSDTAKWSIARYLNCMVTALAYWPLPEVRALLDKAEDVIVPPEELQYLQANANGTGSAAHRAAPAGAPGANATDLAASTLVDTDMLTGVRPAHILYRRGIPSSDFVLVLSGEIIMLVGDENFVNEVRSMGTIGEEALGGQANQFVPTFSARLGPKATRYLKISRELYLKHDQKVKARQ